MVKKADSKTGGDLFIVDNSDADWKVLQYLQEWTEIAHQFDIATGYFEIGSLLALDGQWQKLDKIRILMGDETTQRTRAALLDAVRTRAEKCLDDSLEKEKDKNPFLTGTPAIVDALKSGKIECRAYTKDKFHAKAYITHAKHAVIGASALVGSSNFTFPGLTNNVELNIQLRREVGQLQEWYERHWNDAVDITPEMLRTVERHTREYSPFEVYVRSLQEHLRSHEMTADEWEEQQSTMYPVLATYQKHGYHGLLKRCQKYGGALLCDGVGLGKTFIGLMLIERLVLHENKRVVLFVPKAARETVWVSKIRKYMPELLDGFVSFRIYNHTDLLRKTPAIRQELKQMRNQADVVIIDEAHHFRNTGVRGEEGEERKSRYWEMFDICEGKQMYLLTATPVNNRLTDLQHMIELFSRKQADYFSVAPLGIHSLAGHIRKLEKAIERAARERNILQDDDSDTETNLAEAEDVLKDDALFDELVVQRSRVYVKKSLTEEDGKLLFPEPTSPVVVEYSVKQTYGKLLNMVEDAFHKTKPLFSLAMYYPWEHYIGEGTPDEMVIGRQKQVVRLIRTAFLKRFESSVHAFTASCRTLMKKLIAFYVTHAEDQHTKDRLTKWAVRTKDITGYNPLKQHTLFPDLQELELAADDVVEPEFFQHAYDKRLKPEQFDITPLLEDTLDDLNTISDFLKELNKFQPKQDKKLHALIKLLKKDPILSVHKCLIFTEFKDTARYLAKQLKLEGIEGVLQIDSEANTNQRMTMIQSFAPYYNDSSSADLARRGIPATRILISTDVLSEGLNLQDATRLINYDLHWNPVRLMQRIGRTDRRMDPEVEAQIIKDHPDQEKLRGTVQYYNFLPPDDLNELLSLYRTVTHKTLRISKTFGIESGKLLRPDDHYDILRDFVKLCDGKESQGESLALEYQKLLKMCPGLEKQILQLPNRVFTGKKSPAPKTKAVFFCYARPGWDKDTNAWTIEAGDTQWYLYDLASEKITTDTAEIAALIRSKPDTPRQCVMKQETLSDIRAKLNKHIKNTYLKKVQAPVGVRPTLKAWMEVN